MGSHEIIRMDLDAKYLAVCRREHKRRPRRWDDRPGYQGRRVGAQVFIETSWRMVGSQSPGLKPATRKLKLFHRSIHHALSRSARSTSCAQIRGYRSRGSGLCYRTFVVRARPAQEKAPVQISPLVRAFAAGSLPLPRTLSHGPLREPPNRMRMFMM